MTITLCITYDWKINFKRGQLKKMCPDSRLSFFFDKYYFFLFVLGGNYLGWTELWTLFLRAAASGSDLLSWPEELSGWPSGVQAESEDPSLAQLSGVPHGTDGGGPWASSAWLQSCPLLGGAPTGLAPDHSSATSRHCFLHFAQFLQLFSGEGERSGKFLVYHPQKNKDLGF